MRRKHFFFIIALSLILLAGTAAGCCHISQDNTIPEIDEIKPAPAPSTVLYIPGFRFQQNKKMASVVLERQKREVEFLREAFPGSHVIYMKWDNAVPWEEGVQNANQAMLQLEKQLLALSPEARENLIIIGHSLGARIAIRTMAWLHRHNCRVRRGIFLAAAITDDDPDIPDAIAASILPPVNIYCHADGTLRFVLGLVCRRGSLGAYGAAQPSDRLIQLGIPPTFSGDRWFSNHWSTNYLRYLKEALQLAPQKQKTNVVSPLPRIYYAYDAAEAFLWQDLASFEGWRIQQKRVFPFPCRILDRRDYVRAQGSEDHLRSLWKKISGQTL